MEFVSQHSTRLKPHHQVLFDGGNVHPETMECHRLVTSFEMQQVGPMV